MLSVDLSIRQLDDLIVATLCGELDVSDAASVAAALSAAAGSRAQVVIVDLAGLAFIDSSGVAALAEAGRQARRAGGDLLLAGPQRAVLRVLAITRLSAVLPLHDDVAAAASSVGPSRAARPAPVSLAFVPAT